MNKVIILGHQNPDVDAMVSGYLLEKLLHQKSIDAEFIIPDKEISKESASICMKYGLNPYQYQKELPISLEQYILVDHSNREVNGEIVCVIDHHPSIEGVKIDHYYNKKISSTSCFICQGNEEFFSDEDLRLAFVAAMVDTASFHSTKAREEEHVWIKNLCDERNIDYHDIYKAGLCLTELDHLEKVAFNGLKSYNFHGFKLESSYIQVENTEENNRKILEILTNVKIYLHQSNLDGFVFIVHNMTDFQSTAYLITRDYMKVLEYHQYTSRGDKIIPEVRDKLLKKKKKDKN